MEKLRITEEHIKKASDWAKEAAFYICESDSERAFIYSSFMEGVRIALLTVADNPGEAEDLLKEWWE